MAKSAILGALAFLFVLGCGDDSASQPDANVVLDMAAPTTCPGTAPFDGTCSGNLTCTYGTETCCGMTYPSTVCNCKNGRFQCYATDACLIPSCPDGGT